MPSIITLTFNPCIDVNVEIPALVPENKLRCSAPVLHPGGGGINVARAIKKLGGDATAIYIAAGNNGQELAKMLKEEGVKSICIPTAGNTRENLVVVDQSTGLQYRFILPGPAVAGADLKDLPEIIGLQEGVEFMVVSGSLPPGIPATIFDEMASLAVRKGAKLVVDTSGEGLRRAVSAGVYMIKPSVRELLVLAGKTKDGWYKPGDEKKLGPEEIGAMAKALVDEGNCRVVVVSMGAAGALLVTDEYTRMVQAPIVHKTISSVGAGDSMVAGIVWSLVRGKTLEEAVGYGCACGAAATLNPGTTLFQPGDVERMYDEMKNNMASAARQEINTREQDYTLL